MNRIRRSAVLAKLAEELSEHGSWTGETHLQKAVYLLQELAHAPLEFEYVLYKHGPFSFQLREDIEAMRADAVLQTVSRPYPYGPSLNATPQAQTLVSRYPRTIGQYAPALSWIASTIGDKGVAELERLATAHYLLAQRADLEDDEYRAQELNRLKPHVSLDEARTAVESARRLTEQAKQLFE